MYINDLPEQVKSRVYIHGGCTVKCGWSGGAMVLGKLPVPGRPTILITVGQGPIALAVGVGGGGLDILTLLSPSGGGRVVRWCWVNFQCRGVLQFRS